MTKFEICVLENCPQRPLKEHKRFALLVLGGYAFIAAVFGFAFNLISQPMQERYNLSQRDMSTIVTIGNIFQFGTLPYGILYDFAGPLWISLISTAYIIIGTLCFAFCFNGVITATVVKLSAFNAFVGCGCNLLDMTNCMTILSYFPTEKGAVTAILKTFSGVGESIVGTIYLAFFRDRTDHYFFFLCAYSLTVGGLCISFLRLPSYHLTGYERRKLNMEELHKREARRSVYLRQKPPMWRFYFGLAILIFLILYLPTENALVTYLKLPNSYKITFAVITIFVTLLFMIVALPEQTLHKVKNVLLALFICVNVNKERKQQCTNEPHNDAELLAHEQCCCHATQGDTNLANANEKQEKEQTSLIAEGLSEGVTQEVEVDLDYIAPQYATTFWESLRTPDLWALWWTLFCVGGAELVVIFNSSYIMMSLSGQPIDASKRSLLTVLNGAGSAVGRLWMSGFEAWAQKRKVEDRLPLTIAIFYPTASVILSVTLFLSLPAAALPLAYVVAALGNGFMTASTVLITRTLYAKDNATFYKFCFLPSLLASLILNRALYGEWYTWYAEHHGQSKVCYLRGCVQLPLLIILGLSCTAFATDFLLHIRYCRFCKKVLQERARIKSEARLTRMHNTEMSTETKPCNINVNSNINNEQHQHIERQA